LSLDAQFYELVVQGFRLAVGLDFDWKTQKLFVIDAEQQKIFRMDLNGSNLEPLIWHGLPGAEGIAVDWIGR
jgi:uncharacterized protein YjiK